MTIIRKNGKKRRTMPVRMQVILELKAIIDRCKALTKNRIKKTIFMIFNDRNAVELGATMRELAMAWYGNDSTDSIIAMRQRLQRYRRHTDNKTIVPYPIKTREGVYLHYNHQTKQEYKNIEKMRNDVQAGSDTINIAMIQRLNKSKTKREQEARAEEAEIEYQLSNTTGSTNNKKKRKNGSP